MGKVLMALVHGCRVCRQRRVHPELRAVRMCSRCANQAFASVEVYRRKPTAVRTGGVAIRRQRMQRAR